MHILVATSETQGRRRGDVSRTVEGELVRFPLEPPDQPDGGWDRAFVGLASSKATTTAAVVDHPMLDAPRYRDLLADALVREGVVTRGNPADEAFVDELAERQRTAAAARSAGSIVEIRNGRLHVRIGVP